MATAVPVEVYRPDVLPGLSHGAGVAVVRLRSLGDSLLVTPTLRLLKQWRPDLRVAFLVEPQFVPAVVRNRCIDELIVVPQDAAGRVGSLGQLRRFEPELTVNLHGGSTSSWLTRFSGARWRASFAGLRHGWAHNLMTPPVAPPAGRRSLHTVEHVASLFHHLGLPPALPGPIEMEPDAGACQRMRLALAARGISRRFVFVNANPRSFTMRWEARKWIELLRWVRDQFGLAAVMARSSRSSAERWEETIVEGLPDGAAALITDTTVDDLMALIAECSLMVGSDGGPVHIASGLGRPVVAIFSSTDVDAWAPWQTRSRVVRNPWPCSPCPADRCYAHDQPGCILSVEVEQVKQAVSGVLGTGPSG